MRRHFVLDSSALLALAFNEPGADRVETLLEEAAQDRCLISAAAISLLEIYYTAHRKAGEQAAQAHYLWLRQLPLEIHAELNERWLLTAGRLKARHPMSLADAQIAALALLLKATLVHKDPEYEALSGIVRLEALPLEPKQP